jgi:predicted phage-related endonuclease
VTIETLRPASRDDWLYVRKSTIGASEIAALFGCHPWLTPFKLFAMKTGQHEEERAGIAILENSIHLPPLERGNFMESKAFEALRMLRPVWSIEANTIPGGRMFIDRESGLSTTPDAFLTAPDRQGRGALQVKTVAPMMFKSWKNGDGEIELPLYVAVQAIADAAISGCEWACAGVLINDFWVDFYLIDVPLTTGLMTRIRAEAADFWRRVRENDPYPPNFERDGGMIKDMYADDDGGEIDFASFDSDQYSRLLKILARREALKLCESSGVAAAAERKTIDAELIHMLGNATRGTLVDGRVIEAKTIRKKGFVVEPTTFRPIKIKQQRRTAA